MSQLEIAIAVAKMAHKGQTDKAGRPYWEHPSRVAARLGQVSDEMLAAAWLHDVLEDTDLTRDDLRDFGLNWSVINWVEELTHKKNQSAEDYYAGIGPSARKIKAADISDNLDPERLSQLDDDTIARLVRKYAKARMLLGLGGAS